MIQKNVVYHKSAKGIEAIATRQHGLGPKLRSLLILVDGKKTFDDLAQLSQMLGDTNELLTQLSDQGFIEPGAAAPAHHVPARASAPAPLSPASGPGALAPAMTLAEAQRFASRRLTDLVGPNAQELCLRIEAARNLRDFQVAVSRAEGMLRQVHSAHTADEFAAAVHSHMPAS
ncbi:hypothetical protein [Ramlibacter sp. WS9]|uniref:hypothetical protein n=1 Tax=Ramlibacter sp. WS9 TaxID=1882741 RepID=UPI001144F0A4|nr:hypothetical protein [Ramlibacter sp. WS9]